MVSKIVFYVFYLLIGVPLIAAGQEGRSVNLSDYKWKNRVLFIFSPSQDLDLYQKQLQEMEGEKKGFQDRDLKIFHLTEHGMSMETEERVIDRDVQRLRQAFGVSKEEFSVILIGKDGTEKLRSNSLLQVKELFAVIDAMPMRRREMKNDGP